jgi:hypothetical protein
MVYAFNEYSDTFDSIEFDPKNDNGCCKMHTPLSQAGRSFKYIQVFHVFLLLCNKLVYILTNDIPPYCYQQ